MNSPARCGDQKPAPGSPPRPGPVETFLSLMDSLMCGVLVFDAAGTVMSANSSALRLLSLSEEQLLDQGSCPGHRQLVGADGTALEPDDVPYRSATHRGGPRTTTLFGIEDGDQPVRWLSISYSQITGEVQEFSRATWSPSFPGTASPTYIALVTDMSRKRQLETRLMLKKEKLAATLDASPSAILTFDGAGVIQSVNSAAVRTLGLEEQQILGQDVTIIIPEGFRAHHRKSLRHENGRVQWHPTPGPKEMLARRGDGSLFPVRLSLGEFTSNGERGIVGIIDDLTQQKQAEQYLNGFFSESLDLLCIIDLEGHFVRVNPSFCGLLGYTLEEIMAIPSLSLIHPEDQGSVMAVMDQYLEKSRQNGNSGARPEFSPVECRFLHKDGSFRWVRWMTSASPDWKMFFGSGQDITAWHADREQVSRLAAVLENTTDLVVITDPHGVIEYSNHSARDLLGLPENPRHSDGVSFARYMPKEDRSILLEVGIPTAVSEGSWSGETSVIDIRGRRVPLSHVVLAHQGDDGQVGYLSMIARDISISKEVDRLKSEFVSTVSHELRTPLTSIRGSLGLLAGGVLGKLPEQASEMLEIAQSNTERLIRLINDILDLDKIASGHVELSVQRLQADQVVHDAVDTVRGLAQDGGVRLVTRVGVPDLEFDADPDRMVQVMVNLLSNAIKFSPQGSEVEISVHPYGTEHVRFCVKDHGPGIPPEKQRVVFERFKQIDSSNTRLQGGSGLGLAICKGLVKQHKGRISLASRIGVGSTFMVDLPLPHATPTPADSRDDEEASGTDGRIAVVMASTDQVFGTITQMLAGHAVACSRAKGLLSICRLVNRFSDPLVVIDSRGHEEELTQNLEDLTVCLGSVPTLLLQDEDSPWASMQLPPLWRRARYTDTEIATSIEELLSAAPVHV